MEIKRSSIVSFTSVRIYSEIREFHLWDRLFNEILITLTTFIRRNFRAFASQLFLLNLIGFLCFTFIKLFFFNYSTFSASIAQQIFATRMWESFLNIYFVCKGFVISNYCWEGLWTFICHSILVFSCFSFFDNFKSFWKFVVQTLMFLSISIVFLTGGPNRTFHSSVILSISSRWALHKQDFKNLSFKVFN